MKTKKNLAAVSILLLLFMAISFPLKGLNPRQSINDFLLDEWGKAEGLPNLSIYNIAQSHDNFLWVECNDTVVRYDGKRFILGNKLVTPNTQYQPDTVDHVLVNGKEGDLWLWGDCGLIRYRDNAFADYIFIEDFPFEDFGMAVEDSWGNIWLSTENEHLFRFSRGRINHYGQEEGIPGRGISSMMEDRHGHLWVSDLEGGLFTFKNDSFCTVHLEGITGEQSIKCLYEDRSGVLWIGTKNGLFAKRNETISAYTRKNDLSHNQVTNIFEDSDGNLWVGTTNGLNRIHKNAIGAHQIDHCLENNIINVIFEDNEKSLWIGTEGSGLKRLRRSEFKIVSVSEERQNYISCIHRTRSNDIWIGTFFGDLVKIPIGKTASMTHVTDRNQRIHLDDFISSICDDHQGNLWVGTLKSGLFCITKTGEILEFKNKPGINLKRIQALFIDSRNQLWIGTRNGLCIYHPPESTEKEDGTFTYYKELTKDLPVEYLQFITEDQQGNIFLGTIDGLIRLDQGQIKAGAIHSLLKAASVSFRFKDSADTIWLGTSGTGLVRTNGDKHFFYNDHKETALPFLEVMHISEDGKGNLWFSTEAGICRVSQKDLNDLADRKIQVANLNLKIFSISDGLKSPECTGTGYNSVIKDHRGNFWFATKNGAAVLHPGRVRINKKAPKVFITNVKVNGTNQRAGLSNAPLHFVDSIKFSFTAPTFISQERVNFKFKLEGYDKEWLSLEPGERRTMEYRNLEDGQYQFCVNACNSDGVWSQRGASLPFTVSSSIIYSSTFQVLLIVFLLLVVVAGIFYFRKTAT